jgi:broad specificity phosphatase PhoE
MTTEYAVTTVDLLRHGECAGGDIFRGAADVALTEAGWQTMQCAADNLRQAGEWDQIVSSPLQRCRLFAEHLAGTHAIPCEVVPDLREIDFGDWEGMEVSRVWQQDEQEIARLYTDATAFAPPGGESMSGFQQRVLAAWEQIVARYRNRKLLLVVHGGTVKVLLTGLLGMPLQMTSGFHVPYGCCSRVQIHHGPAGDYIHLVFHNANGN